MGLPHVLIVPSSYPSFYDPVVGVFYQDQARALRGVGVEVGLIHPELPGLSKLRLEALRRNHFTLSVLEESEGRVVRLHGWSFPRSAIVNSLLHVLYLRYLARVYVRRFGVPDLIHAHCALWGGFAASQIARHYNIPFVVTEHSTTFARQQICGWQKSYVCATYARAAKVIAVSRGLACSLSPYLNREVDVVPNVVDTDFFGLPPHPRASLPFTFLTVALMSPKKGLDVLINAFANAFSEQCQKSVKLEIGGDGPERSALEALVDELHVREQIGFLGLLTREEVRNAMWRANIFVSSSRVETFGVVLVEALSTGLQVVATRSGGPEDFVTAEVGTLVEVNNVSALAEALKEAYVRYPQTSTLEGMRRAYTVRGFGEEAVAQELVRHYRDVLSATPVTQS